jgi:hypothetical protein
MHSDSVASYLLGDFWEATLYFREDIRGQVRESLEGQRSQLLTGLVSLWMKVLVLWQIGDFYRFLELIQHLTGKARHRHTNSSGLSSEDFIVDIRR